MRTKITLFIIALSGLVVTQAHAGEVNLSLNPADWDDYTTGGSSYAKSTTPEGYLRFTCQVRRGWIRPKTAYTFNLQNATLRYKWRLNGLGQYCWTGDGPRGFGQMGPNLTTHHSFAGSIVISSNTWIYTQIIVNPDKSWSYSYSYTGYGEASFSQGGAVLNDTQWGNMAEAYLHKLIGDNYGTATYMEFAEVVLVTEDLVVNDAVITSPETGSYFDPNDEITFSADPNGNVDPNTFEWRSSVDGLLGTGPSVASTLSVGTQTITLEFDDTEGGIGQKNITVHIITPPSIDDIPDATISSANGYTGPAPVVAADSQPITWSLTQEPLGMMINTTTGVVSWPSPQAAGSPHTVTIQADNPVGSDDESWQLNVLDPPIIAQLPDANVVEYLTYTGPIPTLEQGSPPVTWSLVQAPAGMSIDAATGVVSWPNAAPSFTPYTITIRATNTVGSDDETWLLSVLSVPVIAALPDASVMLGAPYSSLQPTLIKGVPAVTWTLDTAPAGMSFEADTGVVSWANPTPEGSINSITIVATNSQGSGSQTWDLKVMVPPQIDPVADDTVHEASAYQMTASLSQGTAPVTWNLVAAPPGMSVDPSTGVVSWPHASGYNAPHTITLRAANDVGSHQQTWQLDVLRPPLIKAISDDLLAEGSSYTGPAPMLYHGALPITWSLVTSPVGMTIDPNTGVVSWPQASIVQSPHTVTIAAGNVVGSDTETWTLTVVQPPIIDPIADATTATGTPYTGPLPTLSQGQYVTWALESSPLGMTINAASGVVYWAETQAAGSPHNVSIRATNLAGSNVTSWQLTVMNKPIIAEIPDASATEMLPYTGPTPALVQGDGTIQWSLAQAPAGVTIDTTTGVVSWPNPTVAGSPHPLTITAENIVGSDNESWEVAVPVSYTATVSTDTDLAPMGSAIPLQGQANYISSGVPTPNVPVEIVIEVQGMSRTIDTTSDSSGNFSELFLPLPQEAGVYSIGADHPFGLNDVIDDQFTLVGMRPEPTSTSMQLLVGNPMMGSFQLTNLGDSALTGISTVIDSPANIDLLIDEPNELDSLTSADVNYVITALDSSITSGTVQIELTSAEGATAGFSLNVGVTPLTPELKVYPESLSAGMIRGGQQTVQFEVFNTGAAPTPPLTVLVPDAPWLQLNGPEMIGVHEPNDVTVVSIDLVPADDLPLGIYAGSIIVYGAGMSQTIPFEFNCTSDYVGDLQITAVDEFTYFAAGAPNIDDATVTLTDIIADTVIVSNMPTVAGVLLLEDLPETYYKLEVDAPDHAHFEATVYVAPGVTSQVTAFLSRQVVKYIWTVVPTEIEDVYTVTLTTQYETSVPAPVVTIDPAQVDFADMVEGSMQVDFTITNHGLVAAEDFHLEFDNSDRYDVTMLTDYNGTVGPGVTLTIPVLITDLNYTPPGSPLGLIQAANGQESCERLLGGGFYRVVCGDDGKWNHTPIAMANWSCSLVETIVTILASDDPPDYDPEYNYRSESKPYDVPADSGSGQTTVSTGTSPAQGGVVVIEGDGGNHADRGVGTNQRRPYVTHTTIQVSGNQGGGCDPCPRRRAEAAIDCAASFVLGCPLGILKGITDTITNCTGDTSTSYRCILTGVSTVVGGVAGCVTELSPFGIGWNIAMCIEGIGNACEGVTAGASQEAALDEYMALTGESIVGSLSDSEADLQFLLEQNQRLITVMEALTELLGDPIWFTGFPGEEQLLSDWLEAYWNAIDENGDGNEYITLGERGALIAMPLPGQITAEHIDAVCDRWNRTLDYWQAGIFQAEHVDPGDDANFIDVDVLNQKWQAASDALDASVNDGFEDVFSGVQSGLEQMQESDPAGEEGVCAKVKLEIKQSAVMTRSAFRATLSMDNIGPDDLTNMGVELEITDQAGTPANDRFGIYPPTLTGISDLSGAGFLASLASMRAEWIIVPNSDAAPTEAVSYLVGGQINYSINGLDVTIPITPDVITVKPDPKLHLLYFQESQVYADDPFTPEIEPAIPFSLGLMMKNVGAGTAYNVSISSAQPQIIRHEQDKDILVDFSLIGAQIGAQSITPSLAVNLGHIEPGQTRLARWIMQASLQGEFTSYDASFEHVDTLGDTRLSLMESVEVHELIHAVRSECPEDDQIIDFLVNDEPDTNSLPDTLYLSDGAILPVAAMTDVDVNDLTSGGPLEIEVFVPAAPDGYIYVRLPDPGAGQLQLASVVRSDGIGIRIDDNAWLTDRTIHELGEDPYRETLLHIFDCNSTGLYTVTYTTIDNPLAVTDVGLMTDPVSTIEVTFSGPIDESTFDWTDLILTRNGGPNLIYQPCAIRKISETTYRISGLALLTAPDGLYELRIDLNGILDLDGNSGSGMASSIWLRDVTPWDVNKDHCINLEDHAALATHWQIYGCAFPSWCAGADIDKDGYVDFYDMTQIIEHWLDMCN